MKDEPPFLSDMNNQPVTADMLIRANEAVTVAARARILAGEEPDFMSAFFVIQDEMLDYPREVASAVFFRMHALAELTKAKALGGWVVGKDGDSPLINEAVFRAAAIARLRVLSAGSYGFDANEITALALELSDEEGRG